MISDPSLFFVSFLSLFVFVYYVYDIFLVFLFQVVKWLLKGTNKARDEQVFDK